MKFKIAVALCMLISAGTQAQTDATGSIIGVVVARATGAPIPYSIVSIPSLGRERFANQRGEFVLNAVPAGRHDLLVRHIGYSPSRLNVDVKAGRTDTVRVALEKLVVELDRMTVRATGRCTKPGPPTVASDPTFAPVFEQLRENADRYRLLAESYPFAYAMERMSTVHYVGGETIIQHFDTATIGTGTTWRYVPGGLIVEVARPGNRQVLFNIPTLLQFAEPTFLDNHCFANAGMDVIDGHRVIRIDFSAASKIRRPDVWGSMYLDRETFQIRRSTLRLTRIPDETPQIAAVEVVTDFTEIIPSISVPWTIESSHALHTDRTRPVLPDTAYEHQRILKLTFLKERP